jgi:quercetin dioxygenase-like cupin family protein
LLTRSLCKEKSATFFLYMLREVSLDGAVVTRVLKDQQHAFAFEVTFFNKHPVLVAAAGRKAPAHFHPYQEEYIEVVEGALCVEIEGSERTLLPDNGTVCVPRWARHRVYPPQDYESETTKFLLWADETAETFKLDLMFFTNWYGIQDEVVLHGKEINLLQVMSIFDAGGSYLSFPSWVPFGRYVSRALGVILGRWLGGIIGIQPFYRKWTSDWDAACEKMEKSLFQRRFAVKPKVD